MSIDSENIIKLSTEQEAYDKLGHPKSADAIKSVQCFINWRDNKTDDAFIQMEYRGSLKSKDIALQIQEGQDTTFSTSSLTANKWVRYLREELEEHLRNKDVLPPLTIEAKTEKAKGSKENPKKYDRMQRKAAQDAKRLAEIQEECLQQKARIRELEGLLESRNTRENIYADLAKMGANFGK